MIKKIIWWVVSILSIAGIIIFCCVTDKNKFGSGSELAVIMDGDYNGYYMGLYVKYPDGSFDKKEEKEKFESYNVDGFYYVYSKSLEDNEFSVHLEKFTASVLVVYDSIKDEFIPCEKVFSDQGNVYRLEILNEASGRTATVSSCYNPTRAPRFIILSILLGTLLEMVVALIYRFNIRKLFFVLGISLLTRTALVIPYYFIQSAYGSGAWVLTFGTILFIVVEALVYLFLNKQIEGKDMNVETNNKFGLTKKKVAINLTFALAKNLAALLAFIFVFM